MTREERFQMEMMEEFKKVCTIAEKNGMMIQHKMRMLKLLEQTFPIEKGGRNDKKRYY